MAYNLVCDNFNCSRSSDCEFRNIFVWKGIFERHHDLARISRDLKLFYTNSYSEEMLEYAAEIFRSYRKDDSDEI